MSRQKATIYLDSEIRSATKLAALTSHRSESDVIEEALRRYLRTPEAARGREELRELMDRVSAQFDLRDEDAAALAATEVRAHRKQLGDTPRRRTAHR